MRTRFRWDEETQRTRTELAKAAQDGWMELLSPIPWNWFVTVTFKRPRKDSYLALKAVVDEILAYKPTHAFIGTEYHVSGDVHCHGLVAFPRDHNWGVDSWPLWSGLFARFGRSEVVKPVQLADVNRYVTKYCTKSLTDWHILGFNGVHESLTGGDYA